MINLSKQVKIGIVTILSGCILFFGIEYLKGVNIFKAENYYYVKYKSVAGLAVSSPVTLEGFKVGIVRTMEYDYANPGNIIVELSLDKRLKLPVGTEAIAATDMLGTASIQIHLAPNKGSYYEVGQELLGTNDLGLMGKVTDNLLPKVEQLLPKIDSILSGINTIVNHSGLHESLVNVEDITGELKRTTVSLNRLMANDVPVIVDNLKTISTNFTDVSNNLKEADFNAVINSAHATLENIELITAKMNSDENTLGLLLNSKGLYNNLNNLFSSTDSLVVDLKANPKRYVHFSLFGRKN